MNSLHFHIALLTTTVCCGNWGVSAGTTANASGRLFRRHERHGEKRKVKRWVDENRILEKGAIANDLDKYAQQLLTDDDSGFSMNLSFESETPSCTSEIAMDAYRLLSYNSNQLDYGVLDTSNATTSYETLPQVVTDERFLCQLSNGAIIAIQGTNEQNGEMCTMLNSGLLISAESKNRGGGGECTGNRQVQLMTLLLHSHQEGLKSSTMQGM